ncbi:roadblock/LC7 domain-containing protein [Streptomyces sp. NPDC094143]|uniref:roadblock/LC7 domain-containing protein n=1 Tax=Streptomyces sp. NPDC094143 TaxID=3155310 RepID=UPI00332F5EF8
MAVETDVLDELRGLRTRIPRLTGALAATVDGLVLAHDVPGTEPEGLAALTAAALGVAHRMTDAAARGDFRELLVRGSQGYVATYAAGTTAVLTLLAEDRVNVGRLHLEGRRSGARIADLVATRVGPGTGRHADRPAPAPGTGPVRTPESAPASALDAEEHLIAAPPATASRPIGTLPVRTPQRPAHQPRPQAGT